jgi:predicted transcriptional regulator
MSQRANQNRWRAKNKEFLRDYDKKHKVEINARQIARRKVKIPIGKLCDICNKWRAIQRHHPDYSKPLDVLFVCRSCHSRNL